MARPRMKRIYYTTNFESISVNLTEEAVEIIKEAMRKKGLKQSDLWKNCELGFTKGTVSKMLSGKRNVRLHLLQRLVAYLEINALIRPLGE